MKFSSFLRDFDLQLYGSNFNCFLIFFETDESSNPSVEKALDLFHPRATKKKNTIGCSFFVV